MGKRADQSGLSFPPPMTFYQFLLDDLKLVVVVFGRSSPLARRRDNFSVGSAHDGTMAIGEKIDL